MFDVKEEIKRLDDNLREIQRHGNGQNEIIHRLDLIISGDKNRGVKGLVQMQSDMEEDLRKLKDIVTGGRAIFWAIGVIGIAGIVAAYKVISILSTMSDHLLINVK